MLTDAKPDTFAGGLDHVFQTEATSDGSAIAPKLLASRRVICALPAYLLRHPRPELPSDLAKHACIRLVRWAELYDSWRFIVQGMNETVQVSGKWTTNSADVLHSWFFEGRGLGLKARWDIEEELADGRLVEILTPYTADEISFM